MLVTDHAACGGFINAAQLEIILYQLVINLLGFGIIAKFMQRALYVEDQLTPHDKKAINLAQCRLGGGKCQGAMITKYKIKRLIGQGHSIGTGMNQIDCASGIGAVFLRMDELNRRIVEGRDDGAHLMHRDRLLRPATTQL